jgi:hypothetical protein
MEAAMANISPTQGLATTGKMRKKRRGRPPGTAAAKFTAGTQNKQRGTQQRRTPTTQSYQLSNGRTLVLNII